MGQQETSHEGLKLIPGLHPPPPSRPRRCHSGMRSLLVWGLLTVPMARGAPEPSTNLGVTMGGC